MDKGFGKKFFRLRKAKGWSLAEAGKQLGVSAQQVAKYESTVDDPKIKTIERASGVFGVPLTYFLSDSPAHDISQSYLMVTSDKKENSRDDVVMIPELEPGLLDRSVDVDEEGLSWVARYIQISKSMMPDRDPNNLACYRVKDDSMIPILLPGTIVCVDLSDEPVEDDPHHGNHLYRVRISDAHVVFRHVVISGSHAMVIAIHPDRNKYPPLKIETRSRRVVPG